MIKIIDVDKPEYFFTVCLLFPSISAGKGFDCIDEDEFYNAMIKFNTAFVYTQSENFIYVRLEVLGFGISSNVQIKEF